MKTIVIHFKEAKTHITSADTKFQTVFRIVQAWKKKCVFGGGGGRAFMNSEKKQ